MNENEYEKLLDKLINCKSDNDIFIEKQSLMTYFWGTCDEDILKRDVPQTMKELNETNKRLKARLENIKKITIDSSDLI